jgi:hypothetical protein
MSAQAASLMAAAGVQHLGRPQAGVGPQGQLAGAPDEHDAAVAIPRLSRPERAWLAAAIAEDTPDHHWLPLLAAYLSCAPATHCPPYPT